MFNLVKPFQDAFGTFLAYVPRLVGALLVLLIGYIVAKIVGFAVAKVLQKVGFDKLMQRGGVSTFLERSGTKLTPSGLLGKVVFWFMFVISFTMFASALGVPQISGFLNQMVAYIPRIFAAIAILFLAVLLANFVAGIIRGATNNETFAKVAKFAIVIYAVFAALTQLGIAVTLTGSTLLIVLGAAGLAAAIAFGWGGRDIARDLLGRAFDGVGRPVRGATGTTGSSTPAAHTSADTTANGGTTVGAHESVPGGTTEYHHN